MTNSVKLLNYLDAEGEYLRFYTELDTDFKVGEKVFIVGGNYDNTVYTNREHALYDPYNQYAAGYEVISVDNTVLSNAVTLNISYRDTKFTSGGIESFVFDPKPVYKTDEEIMLSPNQTRESYISKSYFKRGEFNGGKFQDGIFGEFNKIGGLSAIPFQFEKSIKDLKSRLVDIVENNESTIEEVEQALAKLTVISENELSVYNKLESHSLNNNAIFNNNYTNAPAEWTGGVFMGGEWQWGVWKSKYTTDKAGKRQRLNDKQGIKSLLDVSKYDIATFTDNNNTVGYSQLVSGNIGKVFESEMYVEVQQGIVVSIEYIPYQVAQAQANGFDVLLLVNGKSVEYTGDVSIASTGIKTNVIFCVKDKANNPNNFTGGKLLSPHWFSGVFEKGLIDGGKWHGGYFKSGTIRSHYERAYWFNGVFDGCANTAFAENLRWINGVWNNGNWRGDANVAIEAISYENGRVSLSVKTKFKHLFQIGEDVFVSYIKKALQNEYLDNYSDQPNSKLLNMQTFKLVDIVDISANQVNLVVAGDVEQNLSNINLQYAKVSQSYFKKGVWHDGIWESGLRKVTNSTVVSHTYTKQTGELKLRLSELGDVQMGDLVEVTNLQTSTLAVVDNSRAAQTVYKSLDDTYPVLRVDADGIIINLGTNSGIEGVVVSNSEAGASMVATALWHNGDFRSGVWDGGVWKSHTNDSSEFRNLLYFDVQNTNLRSVWKSGYWKGGKFNNAVFLSGVFENGIWENGIMTNLEGESVWVNGEWRNGLLNRGLFLNGKMLDGSIVNGGVSNIDWRAGSYTNGLSVFSNTLNTNRSGRYLSDRNEYDSLSAASIVYIDGNGWVQLDQPSFYQRNYSVIFQDLGFYGESDNPYQNEMFKVKETAAYGTRIKIDNGKSGAKDNPLAAIQKPIVSIGNIVGASELSHSEIIVADTMHKRLIKVNTTTNSVDVYGKILYGVKQHNFDFANIKHIFSVDDSPNIYVVDDKVLKVIYKDTNGVDVMFSVAPSILPHEDVVDMWVAPSLTNIGETVFLLTNLGNVHYWTNSPLESVFKKVSIIPSNATYQIKGFSGARSDSAKTHMILTCVGETNTVLRHAVLDYSFASKVYEVSVYANSSDLDSTSLIVGEIKSIAIKLESSKIKIWVLADDYIDNKQNIYLIEYKKFFSSSVSNTKFLLGHIPSKNIAKIRLGYRSESLSVIEKHSGYDVNGVQTTDTYSVKVGRLGIVALANPADYKLSTQFKGYKVVKAVQTGNTKELSPYLTGRVLYNTKINKEVSFNPNGTIFSAHVVSTCWNNGLFVGSWDAPTYVDHNVLDKKSIFVDGTFEGVFHDGFFLGGTFRDRLNGSSVLKQGHFISESSNINWQSGGVVSDVRYDVDSISFANGMLKVSVETLDNSLKPVGFSKVTRGSIVQLPSLFKKRELTIHSISRGEISVIDDYDEVILKVDMPSIYNAAYWLGAEIFISSHEFTQDLFGYQYVTHVNTEVEQDNREYLFLTIRNKFTFPVGVSTYTFITKPKVLVGEYLKVDSVTITSDDTATVKNKADVFFKIPTPIGSTLNDLKNYYIQDSIEVVSYNGAIQVLAPEYLQLFPLSFVKTHKDVSLNFNDTIRNMYFKNVIADNNSSVVKVDKKTSGVFAENIMVNNSYITSTKATDKLRGSVFLSGKTDRAWESGLWLNLDERGFANGKSIFAGAPTTEFSGTPLQVTGYTLSGADIVLQIVGDATTFADQRHITLRGFSGTKANVLGGTRSKVFKVKSYTTNTVTIKNPLLYYSDYNAGTINAELIADTEVMKIKTSVNNYIGVENANVDMTFNYTMASKSCWNGGDFTGSFSSVWNAGSFRGGVFNPAAKWYGAHESYYWAGKVAVSSVDTGSDYKLSVDLSGSTCEVGDLVYVKFNKKFIGGDLLHIYDDFYSVVLMQNGKMCVENISNNLLPDAQINESGEAINVKYDIQVIRYRKSYTTTNTLISDYNKSQTILAQHGSSVKSYEVARVSFFHGGDFKNSVWHNGLFVGGRMLPQAAGSTVWKYGIKHNGHLGGESYIDTSRHIHWLGGYHESDNSADISSVKNIVWYRGEFNGGAWLNGNWHSLNLSNAYVANTWSVWKKGEWYSKGRSLSVTVIATSVPVSKNIDGYLVNAGDTMFVYSNSNSTVNGLYSYNGTVWAKTASYATYENFVLYVTKGTTKGNRLFHITASALVELNNGNNVNNTSYTLYNESVWHGGTWSSDVVDTKQYTYESNEYKLYALRHGMQFEYPKTNSIWLGGAWLRGVWNGGVFANGSWHSVNTTLAQAGDPVYEQGALYKHDNTQSKWNAGMMLNSIWNGGTVSAIDPLDVVFGDITNFDYLSVSGDFGTLSSFKFKKNDNFTTSILGKKVFDKTAYKTASSEQRVYMQDSSDSILPVYWKRGVWGGGLMQFSYWQNLNLQNIDSNVVSKDTSDNWSVFERGCLYSSYWEGGLLKANTSVNASTFETNGKLDAYSPSTLFYRSQWEKGYWQAVGVNRAADAAVVDKTTHITDALFSRSVWNAGVFEGGVFDLSIWASGAKYAISVKYNGGQITTNAAVTADHNPLHVISSAVANSNPLTTDISGVKNDSTFFSTLSGVRYVGGVDNFASVWVNGTMRGSIWNGGVWQRGMFRDRRFTESDMLDFFDGARASTNTTQVGVWTRGSWLSGYFSYFNDMSMLTSLNNSHFATENGTRCLFMGVKATTFTNQAYDRHSIFGGDITTVFTATLGTGSAAELDHNKSSVFSRRLIRKNAATPYRYFTVFNGTMVNGTLLSNVGENKQNKMVVSPFATVSKYGYVFNNTTRNIDLLTNVAYGGSGEKLSDKVDNTLTTKADGTKFTIPHNPSAVPVLCINSGVLVRIPEASNFLYDVYNGHFHNSSGTNNGIWRHNHSHVGDGSVVTASVKSIEQGSAMLWHVANTNTNHNDVLGGEPNYTNDGLDAYENETGIQSIRQP